MVDADHENVDLSAEFNSIGDLSPVQGRESRERSASPPFADATAADGRRRPSRSIMLNTLTTVPHNHVRVEPTKSSSTTGLEPPDREDSEPGMDDAFRGSPSDPLPPMPLPPSLPIPSARERSAPAPASRGKKRAVPHSRWVRQRTWGADASGGSAGGQKGRKGAEQATRRSPRHRIDIIPESTLGLFRRVTAHCRVEKYDLQAIMETPLGLSAEYVDMEESILMMTTSRHTMMRRPTSARQGRLMSADMSATIHFPNGNGQTPFDEDEEDRAYAFVFDNGPVVLWGFDDLAGEHQFLYCLSQFAHGEILVHLQCVEELEYAFVDTLGRSTQVPRSRIRHDRIFLKTHEKDERVAVSVAMAQSVRLSIFEEALEAGLQRVREIPEAMVERGTTKLPDRAVSERMCEVFLRMLDVNVVSGLRGVPDYFWENDTWQGFYTRVYKYFEIEERIGILNSRYDYIGELFTVVREERQHGQMSRLELIIILLLALQVFATIFKDILERNIEG
ncbi:unnamed protein product [Vitrella brassicaformis CCMP3155]|uniref:DUF155 domain-containing protein n=1 Tax=Vitrella brassicaformis (strain CCMP3155) TaxID=1169540 RepID=A0A0G4EWI3_VITBC|nr:unnamed protein product [Vitrella brassicaformis CCMP3155]|eukprot:CEM02408.1 unnamed protein product [Vitrella brassicaformis CCMP3155]